MAIRLNNLAQLLQDTNRLAEAEPLMRRALAIDETSFGPDHPNVAIGLNNLAQLLQDTNRLAEAEPLIAARSRSTRRATARIIPMWRRPQQSRAAASGHEPPRRGRAADRRALAIDETSFGPDHPNVAIGLNNLAQLLQATNRLAEAEPLYAPRARDRRDRATARIIPKWRSDLNNLALLLQATNRLAEAEPLMRRALAIFETSLGPDHPNTVTARNNLAATGGRSWQGRRVSADSIRRPRPGGVPAKAGIQSLTAALDSRLRGNRSSGEIPRTLGVFARDEILSGSEGPKRARP